MEENWDNLRRKIIGLGEQSTKKSYYPELQQKLNELEKFRFLLNDSNDLVIQADSNSGLVGWFNNSVWRQTGYSPDELYGIHIDSLFITDQHSVYSSFYKSIEVADSITITCIIVRKDDSFMPVEASIKNIILGSEKFVLIIARDITERQIAMQKLKENERRLQKQNDEYQLLNAELNKRNLEILSINQQLQFAKEVAEESDQLKTSFLQNMSHEIRTPLNAIIGFSDLLAEDDLPREKKQAYTSIIINSGMQLLSIVNDILTISALETSKETLTIKQVCINAVLENLYETFLQISRNDQLEIKLNITLPLEQSFIYTDETKINQVITNLISNALKFTKKGFVAFGYVLKNNELEFYVKDTGIGIRKAMHEKIFERFRQADSSISRNYGGTGLGLAISKAHIELLGGRIWVESEPGEGATFYFTIPYNTEHENI